MTLSHQLNRRVLAVHPTVRTFGYAVLESPRRITDWGVKATREEKQKTTLALIAKRLAQYEPDVLVLEDCNARGSRRRTRIRKLVSRLKGLAGRNGIAACAIPKQRVRAVFAALGAPNREEAARVVADKLPELAHWLPQHRKAYMTDHYRMAAFDAAALGLTFYYTRRVQNKALPTPNAV